MSSRSFVAVLAVVALTASARAQVTPYEAWAVAEPNLLYHLDPESPGTLPAPLAITGMSSGEYVFNLFVDPSSGVLHGHTFSNNVFAIDTTTGEATYVATRPFALGDTYWRLKHDPATLALRVLGTTMANAILDPVSLAVSAYSPNPSYAVGDAHFGATPKLTGYAFSNNYPLAATTTAYAIDLTFDTLCTVEPGTGALHTVGALGVNFGYFSGLAVALNGKVYAVNGNGSSTRLYRIDASSGAATDLGAIGGAGTNLFIHDLAFVLDLTSTDVDRDGFPNVIESAIGSSTFDPLDVPFPSAPLPSSPVVSAGVVKTMEIKLRFNATGADQALVKGKLPVPVGFSSAGKQVVIDLGDGLADSFTLNSKGRGTSANGSTLKMQVHPKGGKVKFTLKIAPTSMQTTLADEGLTNVTVKHANRTVNFDVWMPGLRLHESQKVKYHAKAGGTGKAKSP